MYKIEFVNAITEGCDCEDGCCGESSVEPYVVESDSSFECADYCKEQEEKELLFAKPEHAELYVKILHFFGEEELHYSNCKVITYFSYPEESIFFFRLFRYFRNEPMINMLKDMFNYELEPWNAFCFSYLVNYEDVYQYLYSDCDIFKSNENHLYYTFLNETEFRKKLCLEQHNLFLHFDTRPRKTMELSFYSNPKTIEETIKKRKSWEKHFPAITKAINNKDYKEYEKIYEEWIKESL